MAIVGLGVIPGLAAAVSVALIALVEAYMRWSQAKRNGPVETVREQLGELAPTASQATPSVGGRRQ